MCESTTAEEFHLYASKLGYPDNLIKQALTNLGPDTSTADLLEHIIQLHDLLCPKQTNIRRRRDATHLPRYMLVQDSYYKGKEKMPFWVWVKRETIQPVSVNEAIPHHRTKTTSSTGTSS